MCPTADSHQREQPIIFCAQHTVLLSQMRKLEVFPLEHTVSVNDFLTCGHRLRKTATKQPGRFSDHRHRCQERQQPSAHRVQQTSRLSKANQQQRHDDKRQQQVACSGFADKECLNVGLRRDSMQRS